MRSRNSGLEDTRATIEASEVDAVGRFGITDAPVVASVPVGQLKGFVLRCTHMPVQRPILEDIRTN